jgi:hypothetical protein
MLAGVQQMAVRKFKFMLFLLLSSSSATASDSDNVKIENNLSACISISDVKKNTEEEIPVISFYLHVNKSIAECGCKSALGAYTVLSQLAGYNSYILGGKVGLSESGHKQVPLSAEHNLVDKKMLVVGFSCAQAD